jgi:octaprenyl-diphosphate synthase
LCGDYVVSKAIELLLELDNNSISSIFNKCVYNMARAEIQQYFLRNKIPTKEKYINICKGKTGGLFSAVLESCAVYLNLDRITAVKFGEIFGICFQMQNDMLDFSSAEDKKNKIYTAKDILGIENANILSDNYKQELREILGKFPDNNYKSDIERLIIEL